MINVPGTFALRGNKSDLKFKIANGLSNLSVTHNFGKLVSSHHSLKFFFPCIFVQSYMAQMSTVTQKCSLLYSGSPSIKIVFKTSLSLLFKVCEWFFLRQMLCIDVMQENRNTGIQEWMIFHQNKQVSLINKKCF